MSDTLILLQSIKRKHDESNRMLTLVLSALVISIGFLLWLNDVPLLIEYKPLIGLLMMILAAVFYKIPYFAYLLTRRHFAGDERANELMGDDWKQYRMRVLNVTAIHK